MAPNTLDARSRQVKLTYCRRGNDECKMFYLKEPLKNEVPKDKSTIFEREVESSIWSMKGLIFPPFNKFKIPNIRSSIDAQKDFPPKRSLHSN